MRPSVGGIFANNTRVTVGKLPEVAVYSAKTDFPRETRAYTYVIYEKWVHFDDRRILTIGIIKIDL